MKPQKQLNRHDPTNGVWGDCHRTAFAIMFDIPAGQVPHFLEGGGKEQDKRAATWLRKKGYVPMFIPFVDADLAGVLAFMKAMNPGIYYLLTGKSSTGTGHYVVCLDDQIVCDPSINNSGIIGPHTENNAYIVTVFIAKRFTTKK